MVVGRTEKDNEKGFENQDLGRGRGGMFSASQQLISNLFTMVPLEIWGWGGRGR